jgi:hypothetical protein
MKLKTFFLLVLISLISYPQNAGDNVFSGIKIHTIKLTFNEPSYWDSLTYYYNQGLEQYIAAKAEIDGVTFDSIGVRFKGHSSYTHPNNKKPLKLAFDEYVNLKWDGMKAVHLNNCWEDPTFIREKLHLDYCNAVGINAPRGNFAQLYINDTLFAFYSLVENVDKTFLSTHFGNKNGDLFKAVDGFGTIEYLSDFKWYGVDDSNYTPRYELKTDGSATAWPQLLSFLDTLNNSLDPAASIPSKLNMSSVYKVFATDILLANLDSYVNSGRNFYIYFNTGTNKIDWIFWDGGLSFGGFPSSGVSNVENMNICYIKDSTERPLFGKILSTLELKTQFLDTFKTLFTNYFVPAGLFAHIDSIASIIRSNVYADSRKMYTNQQFETNIQSDIVVGLGRKPGLKSFISSRYPNVTSQLGALSVNEKSNITADNFSLDQNYPNPFNPSTIIKFTLPTDGILQLKVFNIAGYEISTLLNESLKAGNHSVSFNANSLPSGVYFYRLLSGSTTITKKMILIK